MKMKYLAYLASGTVMACFVLTSLRAQQQPTPQQAVPAQEQTEIG